LLLIGEGQSIFEGSTLGKILGFTSKIINPEKILNQVTGKESIFENSIFDERTKIILKKSEASVGVLIDKGFSGTGTVFIPVFSSTDSFLLNYAQKLINNSGSQITIMDTAGEVQNNLQFKEAIRSIEQIAPNHIQLVKDKTIEKNFLKRQQLMVVSLKSWKKLIETKSPWLTDIPSTLIIKEK
jgi:hypothetical protein